MVPRHPSERNGGESARWTSGDAAPEPNLPANASGKHSTAESSASRMARRSAHWTIRGPSIRGGPASCRTPASMRCAHHDGKGSGTRCFSAPSPWALAGTSSGSEQPTASRQSERAGANRVRATSSARSNRVRAAATMASMASAGRSGSPRSASAIRCSGTPGRRKPRRTIPAARRGSAMASFIAGTPWRACPPAPHRRGRRGR